MKSYCALPTNKNEKKNDKHYHMVSLFSLLVKKTIMFLVYQQYFVFWRRKLCKMMLQLKNQEGVIKDQTHHKRIFFLTMEYLINKNICCIFTNRFPLHPGFGRRFSIVGYYTKLLRIYFHYISTIHSKRLIGIFL